MPSCGNEAAVNMFVAITHSMADMGCNCESRPGGAPNSVRPPFAQVCALPRVPLKGQLWVYVPFVI